MSLRLAVSALVMRHLAAYRGDRRERRLYLTFDDGPHPSSTPPLLDVLRRHGVRATFFPVGLEAMQQPRILETVLADGHELGNHTMTHPRMDKISVASYASEINGMARLLSSIDGRESRHLRPPYGVLPLKLIFYCLSRSQPLALWSRDSLDYKLSADEVVNGFAQRPPVPGDVLLFHDDGLAAAEALDRLIPAWQGAGYEFGLLSELFRFEQPLRTRG